mmetsp:Transcript_30404/g.77357  ORF Transcript_30404/g.77357 Transcript_30404/m.77357 type:complete len:212 (+) Transcript_30404:13-648(+)
MRPSRRSLILSISHRSCPVKHRRMQRRRAALGPKTLLPRPTTVSPLGRHAKVLGRPRFCSRGEEQLADLGLGLLKHQVQPRIDGVVNGDGALLASEHHATKARLVVLLVRRRGQLVLLRRIGLLPLGAQIEVLNVLLVLLNESAGVLEVLAQIRDLLLHALVLGVDLLRVLVKLRDALLQLHALLPLGRQLDPQDLHPLLAQLPAKLRVLL